MPVYALLAGTLALGWAVFRATYGRLTASGLHPRSARKRALLTAALFLGVGVALGILVRLFSL